MMNHTLRRTLVLALGLMLVAGAVFAQLQSGNLYGTTKDDKGAALPGVTVTMNGQGAPQTLVTDGSGQFRFLGLSPGAYAVKAELQGFSTVDYPNVQIAVGRNTTIEMTLSSAIEDVITVTAESPLLDEKRISTGNTVSQMELAKIPTARDPWAVLQSTPGVLTDRINVGGNESGQQAQYVGPGSGGDQAVWALDGMVITDMAAVGSSPGYFDFDAFEEMQVTTGGSDATISTRGVVLNMVTKRGTNEWRGSARYFEANDSLQSDINADRGDFGKPGAWNQNRTQAAFTQGNRIIKIQDYGAELGGPILRDRLWIWGAYAKPKIDLRTAPVSGFPEGVPDLTTLEDWNAKINWQILDNNSATLFGWNSDKVKIGRNAGPTRPPETTWNQGKFGPSPTAYKVEDTHIVSSNFYVTGMYSKVNGGFALIPQGHTPAFQDAGGVWHNSYLFQTIARPQDQFKADTSTFFNTGTLSHELKIGAGHRTADTTTHLGWDGGFYEQDGLAVGFGPEPPATASLYNLVRDATRSSTATYDNIYAQDTVTVGQLTANIGVRYDKQSGKNLAERLPANSVRPDILPAVSYAGGGAGFDWQDITPRLGLTYALGAERKTLLRVSFSQFADQLASANVQQTNPLGGVSYAYFYYQPQRGNGTLPPLGGISPDGFSSNVNPITGGLIQSSGVDRNLSAPLTNELLLSVEHALLPEFTVGLNLTYRKTNDILSAETLVFDCASGRGCANAASNLNSIGRKATAGDFVLASTLTGTDPHGRAYSIPVYTLRSNVGTRRGTFLENSDLSQEYKGASLVFTKRLSNRWMLRGNFTYSDWQWNVPGGENEDPTAVVTTAGLIRDGAPVLQNSGTGSGSKGNVWVNSKWAYSVNALYQIAPDRPWGFNVAGNVTGREGYPVVYLRNVAATTNNLALRTVLATPEADTYRLDDIRTVDLRVEKDFTFGDFGFTLGVDCFNVLNEGTVLQRRGVLNATNSDFVQEVISPRLFRVGAKISFR